MSIARGEFCLLFAAGMLCAGTDAESEQVYELTADMTPPRLVHQVNPDYSPGSRGVRLQGSVVVGMVVTSGGATKDPHVVKGLDKEVDADVIAAVRKWRFDPAKKKGKPVAVNITVEIAFHPM